MRLDLSLQDVVNATQRATSIRGRGVLDTANQRRVLNTIGQLINAAQLRQVVLLQKSGSLRSARLYPDYRGLVVRRIDADTGTLLHLAGQSHGRKRELRLYQWVKTKVRYAAILHQVMYSVCIAVDRPKYVCFGCAFNAHKTLDVVMSYQRPLGHRHRFRYRRSCPLSGQQ